MATMISRRLNVTSFADKSVFVTQTYVQIYLRKPPPPGGTLYIFGWGRAAKTLKPVPYTRPCSADFATLN